jgi:glycosyltransferase involved in cell wall biosynthesis
VKVCLDAVVLATGAPGIGTYTAGLTTALGALPDVELTVVGPSSMPFEHDASVTFVPVPSAIRGVGSRLFWRERNLRHVLAGAHADVLLVVNPELPLRRVPVPSAVVVHDLFPLTVPALTGRAQQLRFRLLLPRVCERATAIVCVSAATQMALQDTLGVDPAKCRVIGEGPSPFPRLPRAVDAGQPYLLYVGELFPRKNVLTLLDALRTPTDPPVRLVLAGPAEPDVRAEFERQCSERSLGERVRHLGFVSEQRLAELYAGAAALVLPSVDEGFGRPVLDAMARGVPVIASDIPAIRELTGSAAALVGDPVDPTRWRTAIARTLEDESLLRELGERGSARAEEFAWPDIAARFADLLRDLGRSPAAA